MALTNGFKFEDEPELTHGVYAKVIGVVLKNNKMSPADLEVFDSGIRAEIDVAVWKSKAHYDAGLQFSKSKTIKVAFPKEGQEFNGIKGDTALATFFDSVLATAYDIVKSSPEFAEFQDE